MFWRCLMVVATMFSVPCVAEGEHAFAKGQAFTAIITKLASQDGHFALGPHSSGLLCAPEYAWQMADSW